MNDKIIKLRSLSTTVHFKDIVVFLRYVSTVGLLCRQVQFLAIKCKWFVFEEARTFIMNKKACVVSSVAFIKKRNFFELIMINIWCVQQKPAVTFMPELFFNFLYVCYSEQ